MSSIQLLRWPLNQIEQTKTIGIEEKRMLFERIQLVIGSSNEVELFTKKHEWNKIVQLILRWNSQGDLKFFSFITVFPYSESSYDNMLSALILKYYFPIIPCHFPVSRHENFPDYFPSSFLYFFKNLL